jgi:hypothetical protein
MPQRHASELCNQDREVIRRFCVKDSLVTGWVAHKRINRGACIYEVFGGGDYVVRGWVSVLHRPCCLHSVSRR